MAVQLTTIGLITAPFGIKGEVKVYPYSDFPERCYLLKEVLLEKDGLCQSRVVQNAFLHKNMWILLLEGCHTREAAQSLTDVLVKIPSAERVPLPPESYYLDQIVGLAVFTTDGEKLGYVRDILKTGSNDVYVVKMEKEDGESKKGGKEILIPALKSMVKEINLKEGYLSVLLPPGFLEDT